MMHHTHIPQFANAHFYKYRPWDEYAKRTLLENHIFFSSPSEVNDPFDCRFPDIVKPTPEQLKKYLEFQYVYLRNSGLNKSFIRGGLLLFNAYIEASVRKRASPSWEEVVDEAKDLILRRSSFCSMSEVNNSPLMFSHYADGHKGVVFQFHHTLEYSLAHVEAVQYEKVFDVLDIFNDIDCDDELLVQAAMFRKSDHWNYEHEWRAFRLGKSKGVLNFDPRCISGIIFGCKMPVQSRIEAIEIAKKRNHPVTLYESILNDDGINLDIREIPPANA
jgi:hypothetical protein